MTDMFGGAAPALANPPQFSAAYWEKVPRQTIAAKVHKVETTVTENDYSWKEFICRLPDGQMMRFRRKAEEVNQLVMPGTPVNLEAIHNELITGMYLPDVKAWVFRMTAQDLADYTREVSGVLHAQRLAARELMLKSVADALLRALADLGLISPLADDIEADADTEFEGMARYLALVAIGALETGPGGEK